MRNFILFFCIFFVGHQLFSQVALNEERVNKLRESVVKIYAGDKETGTGFFINDKGDVASCFHVVKTCIDFSRDCSKKCVKVRFID